MIPLKDKLPLPATTIKLEQKIHSFDWVDSDEFDPRHTSTHW